MRERERKEVCVEEVGISTMLLWVTTHIKRDGSVENPAEGSPKGNPQKKKNFDKIERERIAEKRIKINNKFKEKKNNESKYTKMQRNVLTI
jgi:hypothetical protein